jgi:RimJ/RimL family protein N-acetyltransferase
MNTTISVDFSPIESEVLGLKIGRCQAGFFEPELLRASVLEAGFDLVRLKVSAEDEMVPARLFQAGIPAFFSGSIRRYDTRITAAPDGDYLHADLVFEAYNGSQDQLLKDMIRGTWGTYPIGYYRTPLLSELISKEAEIECLFRYYKKHNLSTLNPQNTIMFIRHGDQYVGFFALNHLNGNLESHIGGILEPYRRGGYFLDKLRYIKNHCIEHGLSRFLFGARNENAGVQRIFQYVGFQPVGTDNVFHLPLFLNREGESEYLDASGAGQWLDTLLSRVPQSMMRRQIYLLPEAQHAQANSIHTPLLSQDSAFMLVRDQNAQPMAFCLASV